MSIPRGLLAVLASGLFLCTEAGGQELPKSGVLGYDLVYVTSPGGSSRLVALNSTTAPSMLALGGSVPAVPSRWAHRRRVMGALETRICYAPPLTFMTPMGDAPGNGAIHLVDVRSGLSSALIPTGNPAAYDLALDESLQYVFSVEDDGAGGTILRGWSWAIANALIPLDPPTISLAGPPSAAVNRLGVEEENDLLHVPTTEGIHVVSLSPSAPHMQVSQFVDAGDHPPTTNPSRFEHQGVVTWVVGTSDFDVNDAPTEAGFLSWDSSGASDQGIFGTVPTDPSKQWIPAAGTEELAICSNGFDAFVYYLLREPPPGTFFIKPSAVGVVRFVGASAPVTSTILMTDAVGEPFANPSVHGNRVAFESSMGPPFTDRPPDGGEVVSIIYSPLDPLGAGTTDGLLGVPDPLGGRISTRGVDQPTWTADGSRVMSATSYFPGAPQPHEPGLEVLNVDADIPVDEYISPHTVVPNDVFPNQSIRFPSRFDPRDPGAASFLDGLTFYGNVFHDGMASLCATENGEFGQKQPGSFSLDPDTVNFPAILPPSFDDANASKVPVPGEFGARRTTWNLVPGMGISGLMMSAAIEDEVHVQPSGHNFLAELGLADEMTPIVIPLPPGWITTSEFLSL